MKLAWASTLCLALFWAIIAPAPADAPIRTLVYQYSYDARGFSGSSSAIGGIKSDTSRGSASRTGEITVEVAAATQDGGLVVDITQTIDRTPRPLETIRCALYGATSDVVCDQNVHATREETVLLTYLGRDFYDVSRLDPQGDWSTSPKMNPGKVSILNSFKATKTDGDIVTIAVDREERNGDFRATTTGTLLYNSAMEVPTSVRIATAGARTGAQGDMNVSLTLISDSMAKPTGSTPH
jgi:hypothetical protein